MWPGRTPGWGASLQPAAAGFVADREGGPSGAVSTARLNRPRVRALYPRLSLCARHPDEAAIYAGQRGAARERHRQFQFVAEQR